MSRSRETRHRATARFGRLDIARIGGSGPLTRVDGFFGELVPTLQVGSAIPDFLRPPAPLAGTDGTN